MRVPSPVSTVGLLVVLAALLAWPVPVEAQGRRARVGRPVVVSAGFYRPFYGPFFGHPFMWGGMWGGPMWSPFWGGPWMFPMGPQPGEARLQVSPKDTEVYLDGRLVGVVDDFDGFTQRLRVPPGEYVLTLYRDGTRPWQRPVLLAQGSTLKIQHTMEPLPDGEPMPTRPVPAPDTQLPPQPAQAGHGRSAASGAEGAGAVPAAGGALSVRVQPDAAEVLIDGETWGAAASGTRLVVTVAAGRHRVEVRMPGYETFETDVEVAPGATVPLNVSLRPNRDE